MFFPFGHTRELRFAEQWSSSVAKSVGTPCRENFRSWTLQRSTCVSIPLQLVATAIRLLILPHGFPSEIHAKTAVEWELLSLSSVTCPKTCEMDKPWDWQVMTKPGTLLRWSETDFIDVQTRSTIGLVLQLHHLFWSHVPTPLSSLRNEGTSTTICSERRTISRGVPRLKMEMVAFEWSINEL
jgi:hypothetical protein